jgi:hypothetical protein
LTSLIEDATLNAEFRRGLKDLQDAVLTPFPDSMMKSRDEPGTIANPTQLIVTEEIKGKKFSIDEFRAIAQQRENEQSRGKEMDR